MGRGRRWSSGPGEHDTGHGGGRHDSSYGGRYGGRGVWGMSSSPDRVSRNNDRGQQNRHDFESSNVQDSNAAWSLPYKSFHESMMAAAKNSKESPSRGKSPSRNSGGGENHDRARSRSRSSERFDGASATATRFSYHESMLAKARSSVSKNEPTSCHAYTDARDCKIDGDPQSRQENSRSSPNTDQALFGNDKSTPMNQIPASYIEQRERATVSAEASMGNQEDMSMFETTA
ncbi:uncharacterized protein LOC142522766 [Primulina tabacum]|uniref:uncharacterized protein LOC142522766 n=1 Tax=Primulina tabacum TaxID=48773 RepID=UPI003F59385D